MFEYTRAFGSFAADDVPRARAFYEETLGIRVSEENGLLQLHLGFPGGGMPGGIGAPGGTLIAPGGSGAPGGSIIAPGGTNPGGGPMNPPGGTIPLPSTTNPGSSFDSLPRP